MAEVEVQSGGTTSGKTFYDFAGKSFYEILGVAEDAEYAEIKAAYDREYIKYNTSRDKAKASARFFVVSEALDCLKDPQKKREYDEKLKGPKTPPPKGTPRLVVECKTDYTFRDIRRGEVLNVNKIVIKNPEGGLLQGSIKSSAPWLVPDRNKILEKHEQELYVNIFTSKIPTNIYNATGNMTIDTNGGPPYVLPFRVILEDLEIAADRFRKTYVPLAAACAGFIGSFGNSHFLNFMAGAIIVGFITYVLAKQLVQLFLNEGIDIFKLPPVLIQLAAGGVVILTIMAHSVGDSRAVPNLVPAPVSVPAQVSETPPVPEPTPIQAETEQQEHKVISEQSKSFKLPSKNNATQDEVKNVILNFYDSYQTENLDLYMSYVHDNAVFKSNKYLLHGKENIRKRRILTFASLDNFSYNMKKINISVSGITAEVYDELKLSYSSRKTGKRLHESVRETIKLVKENDRWLIVEDIED